MSRRFNPFLCFVLLASLIQLLVLPPNLASASTNGCGSELEIGDRTDHLSFCRSFDLNASDGGYYRGVDFVATRFSTESEASHSLDSILDAYLSRGYYTQIGTDYVFGDEAYIVTRKVGEGGTLSTTHIMFRVDEIVNVWSNSAYSGNPIEFFHAVYAAMGIKRSLPNVSPLDQLSGMVPTADAVPEEYVLKSEEVVEENSREQGPVSAPTSTPTPLPTPTPRPTSPASNGKALQIISLSNKSAGIGDGTFYEYVEVRNNSSTLYPYVGVEATCRDASGVVVGTGIGNTANVAPGETVVITVIMLSAPTCDTISVRFDALTYFYS